VAPSAVTIDFWNTLFGTENGAEREQQRRRSLNHELASAGHAFEDEQLARARDVALEHFRHHWLEKQRTPGAVELVEVMLADLGAPLEPEAVGRVAEVFARGVVDHPPQLLPGAEAALERLSADVPLAIISDTAFSPGAVLRELMENVGIVNHFSTFVFSDETGIAKPDPAAFERALGEVGADAARAVHIGDIERTDIQGARAFGMRAVLYQNDEHRHRLAEDETDADATIAHWDELDTVLAELVG
jgi:HAD superfamily hydrolase (TIGR01509 family)